MGGPRAYLNILVEPTEDLIFGFARTLRDLGFQLLCDEAHLGTIQQQITSFAHDHDQQVSAAFECAHPILGERLGFWFYPAAGYNGPIGTLLFVLSFDYFKVIGYPDPVVPGAQQILLPLCCQLGLRLPALVIELQSQLETMIDAWQALIEGKEPQGFLLYLSPNTKWQNPGRWGHAVQLDNGGTIFSIPLRYQP